MKKIKKGEDQLLTKLVTEEYLEKRFDARLESFEDMRKDYYEFRDRVLNTLDWLVGAFKKFDEEHMVLTHTHSFVQEKIHNHEQRISV